MSGDPTEQTVSEAFAAHIADDLHDEFHCDFPGFEFEDARLQRIATYAADSVSLYALGVDPDVPVSQLRHDLVIGARVMACRSRPERDGDLLPSDYVAIGWNACLLHLLNGDSSASSPSLLTDRLGGDGDSDGPSPGPP